MSCQSLEADDKSGHLELWELLSCNESRRQHTNLNVIDMGGIKKEGDYDYFKGGRICFYSST